MIEISLGRIDLNNISFLISDAKRASEDFLIGFPFRKHMGIGSRTLLERNSSQLDGIDCSSVPLAIDPSPCGTLVRLTIARLQSTGERHSNKVGTEISDTDDIDDATKNIPNVSIPLATPTQPSHAASIYSTTLMRICSQMPI